jgi:predicted acylesterase/phospholipase RssA
MVLRKRVLAIDGGGIRGILPALFLRELEYSSNLSIGDLFDFVIGTSTGGLIALAATQPRARTANEILDIYLHHADKIFGKARSSIGQLFFGPKYKNDGLRELCKLLFGEERLSRARVPTAVTAYDIVERRPRLLSSWEAAKKQDEDCFLWQAALATAAAPTYFPAVQIGDKTLIDGGVFANNPAAIALAEARSRWNDAELVILSLGTGVSKIGHLPKNANSWGAANWVGPLIECIFDGSSDSVDLIVKALLGDHYHRFQITLHPDLASMDSISNSSIDQLRAAGARAVAEQKDRISAASQMLLTKEDGPL